MIFTSLDVFYQVIINGASHVKVNLFLIHLHAKISIGDIMKKLTITVDDKVNNGLHARIGRGNISRFLNGMARPHVIADDIEAGYMAMADQLTTISKHRLSTKIETVTAQEIDEIGRVIRLQLAM